MSLHTLLGYQALIEFRVSWAFAVQGIFCFILEVSKHFDSEIWKYGGL